MIVLVLLNVGMKQNKITLQCPFLPILTVLMALQKSLEVFVAVHTSGHYGSTSVLL